MTRQLLNRHFSGFLAVFPQKVFPGLPSLSPWLLCLPHKSSKTAGMCFCTPPPCQSSASWELRWGFMRPGRAEALIKNLLNETPAQSQPKGAPDGGNQKGDQLSEGWAVVLSSQHPHQSQPSYSSLAQELNTVTRPPLRFSWFPCKEP